MALPPLSSIEAAHNRVGYEAAALLAGMLKGQAAPRKPLLIAPREIIARPSTDMLAVGDPVIATALRLIRAIIRPYVEPGQGLLRLTRGGF